MRSRISINSIINSCIMTSHSILDTIENKTVFPIVSTEVRGNYNYDQRSHLMDHRIQPISVEEYGALKVAGYTVPAYANEGVILIRHPYKPKTLVDMDYDQLLYLQEKFGDYAIILNYLGVTTQELKAKITKYQTREIDADGKMKVKTKFSLKGSFHRLTRDKYEIQFSKSISGTGKRDFELAKTYAETVGLASDPFIKEILNLREHNPVPSYFCDVVISKDYNDIFDAAATLSVLGGTFNLDGTFSRKVENRNQISISQKLYFEEKKPKP